MDQQRFYRTTLLCLSKWIISPVLSRIIYQRLLALKATGFDVPLNCIEEVVDADPNCLQSLRWLLECCLLYGASNVTYFSALGDAAVVSIHPYILAQSLPVLQIVHRTKVAIELSDYSASSGSHREGLDGGIQRVRGLYWVAAPARHFVWFLFGGTKPKQTSRLKYQWWTKFWKKVEEDSEDQRRHGFSLALRGDKRIRSKRCR